MSGANTSAGTNLPAQDGAHALSLSMDEATDQDHVAPVEPEETKHEDDAWVLVEASGQKGAWDGAAAGMKQRARMNDRATDDVLLLQRDFAENCMIILADGCTATMRVSEELRVKMQTQR